MSQSARPAPKDGGRAGKRLKNKEKEMAESRANVEAAAKALAPFLSKDQQADFRVDRMRGENRPESSPFSYTPNINAVRPKSQGWTFGNSARFKEQKKNGAVTGAGPFISRHHMADLLCMSSPGPLAYEIKGFPNKKRAATQFWGTLADNADRRQRQKRAESAGADVGPAAYKPNHAILKRKAARAVLGPGYKESLEIKQIKELQRENRIQAEDAAALQKEAAAEQLNALTIDFEQWKHTQNYTPQHSFAKPPHVRDVTFTRPRNGPEPWERVSFLTQDRHGCRIENSTRRIGPSKYTPNYNTNHLRSPRMPFAAADRFGTGGAAKIFISAAHCKQNFGMDSPGPLAYNHKAHDMCYKTTKPQTARQAGLGAWIP